MAPPHRHLQRHADVPRRRFSRSPLDTQRLPTDPFVLQCTMVERHVLAYTGREMGFVIFIFIFV